jgi:phosphate transport system permease protein
LLTIAGRSLSGLTPKEPVQKHKPLDKEGTALNKACISEAVLTTLGIVLSLLFESIKFFTAVSIFDFITGTNWAPGRAFVRDASVQTADVENVFGAVPLFWGTFFIAMIAMCVAVPIGLFSGIFMAEYASRKIRRIYPI